MKNNHFGSLSIKLLTLKQSASFKKLGKIGQNSVSKPGDSRQVVQGTKAKSSAKLCRPISNALTQEFWRGGAD